MAQYLHLRYSLIPYLYSLGQATYETGAPFMRALFMDFPHDPAVSNLGDEYMLGPALLVAPVTEQGRTVTLAWDQATSRLSVTGGDPGWVGDLARLTQVIGH
jgi:alpha-glucosidase (family GH31 glycosyl hydrolase)